MITTAGSSPAPPGGARPWLEHTRGPVLCGAVLCGRCGQVLWIAPPGWAGQVAWPEGCRIASDGTPGGIMFNIGGWRYTRCQPYIPRLGDRPGPP
jgi:hypothetical protein